MTFMVTASQMQRRWVAGACVVAVALSLVGCAYSFKRGGGALIESVSVEQLENQTNRAGVADRITELLVDALIADGRIDVVGPESAEALLDGKLTGYDRKPFEFDENDQVSRYAVELTVQLTLSKRESGAEIWSATFKREGLYDAFEESEEDGQSAAAKLIVEDIMSKTTRSW
ncbi:MAG TPA: LPS assembly lipoprotein LptE [candidate division Zixibacteria bacterium]|nr:LPS assembly lipoprotein LptE [candidate division Zixibacteria bacterium]